MVDIEKIRITQEQRLSPVLKAWDEAKEHLEDAIARAKAREEDFHAISDDIRRNLSAIDFVLSMANGHEGKAPAPKPATTEFNRPRLMTAEDPRQDLRHDDETGASARAYGGLLRRSTRPLFPDMQKSA